MANYSRAQLAALYGSTAKQARGKYNATKTQVDGITFDSKKEATYYIGLKQQQQAGDVRYFHRQVRFDLPGNTAYRVDFQIFYADGTVRYVDVKGYLTKEFIRAKKQVEALYPVTIETE